MPTCDEGVPGGLGGAPPGHGLETVGYALVPGGLRGETLRHEPVPDGREAVPARREAVPKGRGHATFGRGLVPDGHHLMPRGHRHGTSGHGLVPFTQLPAPRPLGRGAPLATKRRGMKRALIALVLVPLAGVGLLLVGDAARPRPDPAPAAAAPAFSRPKTALAVPSATAATPPPKVEAKPAAAPAPTATKDEPSPERLAKLLAVATDGETADADREAALTEIAHSPYANAETVARLGRLAASAASDLEARYEATGALRDLALREDLAAATRAALLEVAGNAPSTDLRSNALTSIRASGASEAELGKLTAFLGDQDAVVRVSAALVLETADGAARTVTGPAIEQAFAKETDPAVGEALVSAALRASAGDPALLERLGASEAARTMPEAAKKIARFRALIAAGETDPSRIEKLAAAN